MSQYESRNWGRVLCALCVALISFRSVPADTVDATLQAHSGYRIVRWNATLKGHVAERGADGHYHPLGAATPVKGSDPILGSGRAAEYRTIINDTQAGFTDVGTLQFAGGELQFTGVYPTHNDSTVIKDVIQTVMVERVTGGTGAFDGASGYFLLNSTLSKQSDFNASLNGLLFVKDSASVAQQQSLDQRCKGFNPSSLPHSAKVRSIEVDSAKNGKGDTCAIHGAIVSSAKSTINFRVDLPASALWNSRLMMVGGGGFDGIVPTEHESGLWAAKILGADAEKLKSYVLASSDSGHQGRGAHPIEDFSWVDGNGEGLRNHAYLANHLVLEVASDITRQFYGRAPSKRYIMGGSNGGRAGLVAAQRYPDDYDGILSFEPAIAQEGFAANLGPEMLRHIFSHPDNWMDKAHIELFERAELEACDQLDGLKDGILSNADACHFDGSTLKCRDQDRQGCLTAGQIESIARIRKNKQVPVVLADEVVGYPAFGIGAETEDWVDYIFGPSFESRGAADYVLADQIVKYGITHDPNASVMTHDPTKWADAYRQLSDQIDATNPDLSRFFARGGKLIVWFGASDNCVTFRRTADYLDSVNRRVGPSAKQSMRFYVSPAMGHSMAGAGESTMPLLSTLEQWEMKSAAPRQVVATLVRQKGQRPLCEYPAFPRYRGKGDPTSAASFTCSVD